MAFTTLEEQRIQKIEQMLNDLQIAVNKLVTIDQLKQLLLIKQAQVNNIQSQLTSLESQVQVLQK